MKYGSILILNFSSNEKGQIDRLVTFLWCKKHKTIHNFKDLILLKSLVNNHLASLSKYYDGVS